MKHRFLSLLALFAVTFIQVAPLRSADLSITVTSVVAGPNADKVTGTAGATITAGQLLYFDSVAGTYKLADANASATTAMVVAMAANGASAGQPITVIRSDDDLTLSTTSLLSMAYPIYVLSANPGGIAPSADIAAGWFPVPVIVAKSDKKCSFKIALRGTAVAVAP